MPKKRDKNFIVGIDIGTSKVSAVIGFVNAEDKLEILGVGTELYCSRGLKKGGAINIDATVQAIKQAVQEAESMVGEYRAQGVYVGIAGTHTRSFNSNGIVAIHNQEVTPDDIERVIDAAKAVVIPMDQKIIHILPQEFIVDGQIGIQEPLGMSGVRLEAKAHVVTGSISLTHNIEKCIERSELEAEEIVLESVAAGFSVLTEDEKQLGVCLLDIGAGTTDIVVFVDGGVRHTATLPVAGDQVTNDIAVAFRTPTQSAESLKIQYACALPHLAKKEETIEIASLGDRAQRSIARVKLAQVIEPRFEELFSLAQAELRRYGLEPFLNSGIVLTGGSARMEGVIELAEQVFHMPVRLGVPRNMTGLADVVRNPMYSVAVGLLQYGRYSREQRRSELATLGVKGLLGRVKNWFQGNF